MPTIYSANSAWPVQQSLNEVKHKSGLFTCTATFLRPVGNEDLPTQIETSIGPVDVWPEPVVATGTDGFQTITATGYGVWDASISEVTYSYEIGVVWVIADFTKTCTDPGACEDGTPCGALRFWRHLSKSFPAVFESVHIKKIGTAFPPLVRPLRILSLGGEDITSKGYSISYLEPTITSANYSGDFSHKTLSFATIPSMVKTNTYGTVSETEVVYGIRSSYNEVDTGTRADVYFGTFNREPSADWQGCN